MTDSIADLTFVTVKPGGLLELWTPERPTDYEQACVVGRDCGAELLALMRHTGNHAHFGSVIRAITRGGVFGGVEIGFCSVFGIALLNGHSVNEPLTVEPLSAAA